MLDQVAWFAARGAGAVSLLMLTATVCLGMVTATRFQATGLALASRILPRGTISGTAGAIRATVL